MEMHSRGCPLVIKELSSLVMIKFLCFQIFCHVCTMYMYDVGLCNFSVELITTKGKHEQQLFLVTCSYLIASMDPCNLQLIVVRDKNDHYGYIIRYMGMFQGV